MNNESPENPFRLGGRYRNRKGFFTVISLDGDKMKIQWDNGEEITDTIASQARILRNMQRETTPTRPRSNRSTKPVAPPSTLGTVLAAVLNPGADFSSPAAQKCTRCQLGLSQRPIIMIGSQAFCYRCAKSEYPARMDDVRRARNREARRIAAARREYELALLPYECAKQRYMAQRDAAANVGFYTERNKWLIAWAIAIPCGILLPIVGLVAIFPALLVMQPIWNRAHRIRENLLGAFDQTHAPPPPFDRTAPRPTTHIADPIVTLHPDCSAPAKIGIGYDREQILYRDDFTCQSCGRRFASDELEVHHLLARAQKGSDSFRNLITLCKECHFHEDWFDHVHKDNLQRISQKRLETFKLLHPRFRRRRLWD